MSETRIVLGRGETAALLWSQVRNRRSIGTCAACKGKRYIHRFDPLTGFCGDCLERSRVLDDDDIGGES